MDDVNNRKQLETGSAKTAFFVGVVLCICFACSDIPDLKKTDFSPVDNKLNPNTADVYELIQLPSIGPAKAQAIAEYRKNNKITSAEDLENVKGIGEKTANKIKPLLKFND